MREKSRAPRRCLDQFEERVLALAAHHEIDVLGVQRGVGVERREVAAPNDGHLRILLAKRAAQRHRRHHLRSRHHRDAPASRRRAARHDGVDGRPADRGSTLPSTIA